VQTLAETSFGLADPFAATLRSHVTRLRARYREALRAEVSQTMDTDDDVDAELRELLRLLTAS